MSGPTSRSSGSVSPTDPAAEALGSLEGIVLALETPSEQLRVALVEMAMEFKEHGNPRYVRDAEDFARFLSRARGEAEGQSLAAGSVPMSRFWLVQDGRFLGSSGLRHQLTPELEHEGGNIGYDIRPSARQKGLERSFWVSLLNGLPQEVSLG